MHAVWNFSGLGEAIVSDIHKYSNDWKFGMKQSKFVGGILY